jgi:hypothetical protein
MIGAHHIFSSLHVPAKEKTRLKNKTNLPAAIQIS